MKPTLRFSSFLIYLSSFIFCNGQNPLVKQWDYRYGGTDFEELYSFKKTLDGGFIMGGYSYSGVGGNKTQATQGGGDFWLVKTDSNGIYQWDKRFGGSGEEEFAAVEVCRDGGYIMIGYSASPISGDKTQGLQGSYDYWVVKTDSVGTKLWDKDFGGPDYDYPKSIRQTSDGGYIIGGYSLSGAGGDKSQPTLGFDDYWIIKIDSAGTKIWDKDFGGTDDDDLYSVRQTPDGGYILGGYSYSGINGDKTQPSQGGDDYWLVKTDALGNKLWDKDFGSSGIDLLYALEVANDGGFIMGGVSQTGASGDKTQAGWGGYEWWVLKTDSLGIKQWDKDFGGSQNEDEFNYIEQTTDSGFLFSGTSYSPISGMKTENNLGNEQTWVVKTDALGIKQWDKTLHTNSNTNHDEYGAATQARDGCYAMANYTHSGAAGDKSQANWNNSADFWIIKFCDTTLQAPPQPVANYGASSTSFCQGTCINYNNLSQNATGYQWTFNGANPSTSTAPIPLNICYDTAGSYDVTLIATNASGSNTLTFNNYITVLPAPQINLGNDTSVCLPDTLTLDATTAGATYLWSDGSTTASASAYQTGEYMVTVTLSGCTGADSIHLTENPKPPASVTANQAIFCSGDSAQICGNAGMVSYLWNTSETTECITTQLAGNYYVTLTDANGCSASSNHLAITVYSPPPVSISVNGDTLSAFNATTYQWFLNGNIIPGATSQTYIATQGGSYTVEATDSNGCAATSTAVIISGIAPLSQGEGLGMRIYPNPNESGRWNLEVGKELIGSQLEIFDSEGRLVLTTNIKHQMTNIELNVEKGIYLLKIISARDVVTRKLIKL